MSEWKLCQIDKSDKLKSLFRKLANLLLTTQNHALKYRERKTFERCLL